MKDGSHVLKDHNWQPRLLYPTKLSIIIDREIKTFHDLKKTLERILQSKENDKYIQVASRKDSTMIVNEN